MVTIDFLNQQFKKFKEQLNGNEGGLLQEVRQQALQLVERSGLPTKKDEDWRFTDPEPLLKQQWLPADQAFGQQMTLESIKPFLYPDFDGVNLVFVNGFFMAHLSQIPDAKSGVSIQSLRAQKEFPSLLEESSFNEKNVFAALNTAFFTDGLVIEIADNVVLKTPINILHLTVSQAHPVSTVVRNRVKVGQHAFVRIIETFLSLNEDNQFTNALTLFDVEENGKAVHSKIQNENLNALHVGNVFVRQKAHSHYVSNNITLGGKLVRNNIQVELNGKGAEAVLNGLYMGHKDQHHDNHTLIEHAVPECTSYELYQGILSDQASAVFAGKILVKPGAQKTDAIQANNCLLLSDDARIDTMPQLEIYADDVKCTHGATVGQLDEEAIFYLRSRGISEKRAKNLLIYSFAERIIEQIKVPAVREYVDQCILKRFKEDMNFVK